MTTPERVDPSKLGALYPRAKTYDEQMADRAEIDRLRESRKPKLITFRASFLLTFYCALIIAIIWVMPITFSFNLMAGAFTAIGSLIALVFYTKWLTARIIAIYDINGKNARPLLMLYPILLGCFVIVLYLLVGWTFLASLPLAGLLLVVHFIIMWGIAGLMKNVG